MCSLTQPLLIGLKKFQSSCSYFGAANTGGYVAGKLQLVRAAANRLGSPGVAGGATLGQNSNLFQVRRSSVVRHKQHEQFTAELGTNALARTSSVRSRV